MIRFFAKPSRPLWIGILLLVYVGGCKSPSATDPQPAANSYLVSSTPVGEYSKDQLLTRATSTPGGSLIGALIQQSIRVRRLVYKTQNWDGTTVMASGLLILPVTTAAVPMIGQQHGTIYDDANAPSNYGPGSEAYQVASLFAANGFILVCPDYIGYGESKNVPHPYSHRATLASASLDMLRAAREYIQTDASVNWDKRVYLAGYSEGGSATMALYKKMQDEVPTEFNLRAVSCGAGAYDVSGFTTALLSKPSSGEVNANRTFVWTLLTYDQIYKLNRPLSFYFKEPYLTEVTKNRQASTITVSLDQIFTDPFKQGFLNGTDTPFINAVADNNSYDWKPLTTLQLYHGDADTQVFFLNSQNAYNAMEKRGAGATVQLIPLPGKTHAGGITDWLLGSYTLFTTTK